MSTGETPSYVLGDTSMGNYTTGTTQSKMNGPTALALDVANQLLYVADSGNNRVMVFPAKGNASWGGNGENALYELGVPNGAGDFTTQGSAAATQSTFGPVGLAYDSTNQLLYVSDGNNNRVLVFPAYGNGSWGGNGENATYVLGQSNFTNNSINEGNNNYYPSQSSMWYPSDVAVDPAHNLVYVGDMTNGRIMVFSTVSLSNGENATAVLGEPNFVTGWRNQGSGGNTSRSLMDGPAGLAIDPTNQLLYSSDLIDSRILEFNVSSLPNAQFSTVTQNGNDGCAISSLGALYCWGNNQWGEDGLGNQSTALNTNSTNFIFAPQQVGTATNWTVISQAIGTDNNIYDAAGCGVAGGALYCMGNNAYGELGVGNTTQYYSPQQVGSATNWTAVSTSGTDTCGIAGGKLYCWGENLYGEVGNGAPNSNAVFVTSTTTNGGFGSVTAANTACQNASTTGGSIAPAGTYLAWASTIKTGNTGANDPYTTFTNKTLPYKDVAGNLIAASWNGLLSGTLLHGITLDQTGTTQSGVAWTNVSGTSGQASTNGSSTTKNCAAWTVGTSGDSGNTGTLGSTSSTWSKSSSTSACNTAAHLLCFEQSTATNEVTSPVQIGSDTTWTVISQGGYDTCGIDNGKLYCWGRNSAGELGLGNTTEYTTPQQVGVATNWIAVSQGGQDTCGIRGSSGSGALYCWGGNFNGELGLGNSTSYTTPQQVGTDTTWTAISVNNIDNGWNGDACGIDNGKLYCSGYNNNGQLGLGNTTNYNTFQQVGALTTWTAVSQGYQNTCGIAGSTLYCWGAGGNQLGLGYTYAQYETPQAVAIFDLNVENATDEIGQYASQTTKQPGKRRERSQLLVSR
jgi:alpha-tubulin suppressor-like RCC1 family protein